MENDFSIRFRSLLGGRTDAISFLLVSLFFLFIFFFFMFFVFFFAFLLLFFRVLNRFEEREKRFFFLIPFDFVFRSLPFSLF